jgi:hypothetical protein
MSEVKIVRPDGSTSAEQEKRLLEGNKPEDDRKCWRGLKVAFIVLIILLTGITMGLAAYLVYRENNPPPSSPPVSPVGPPPPPLILTAKPVKLPSLSPTPTPTAPPTE